MKILNLAAVLVMCVFSATVFAKTGEDKCAPDVYKAVKRHLKINEFAPRRDGGNVISSSCRAWPYKTNLLLAAFAYDEGVKDEKQLVVLILDAKKKNLISSFRQEIGEDAATEVGEYSVKLDTARYQLSESIRAFGVRFNSSANGPNCGDGYWGDELTLFAPEGKNLRPLATLNLYHQRWLEGCPAATSHALWEDATLTVSMSEASTNGLFDLLITAKITVNAMDAPTRNLKNRIEQHTMRYNGKSYQKGKPVPWWLAI